MSSMTKTGTMTGKKRQSLFAKFKFMLQTNRLGDLLVLKGSLSESDLHRALAAQRAGSAKLGEILVREQLATRRVIYSTLAQQWTVRTTAAALTCIISFSSVGVRPARAGIIDDVPAKLSLVSQGANAYTPVSYYPSLFGTEERTSTNIQPFAKWTGMFARFDRDAHAAKFKPELTEWRNELRPLVGMPLRQQVERVNAMMNARPYIEDSANYNVSDYWADPLEFLARGGDCEDYAIAKYASLRMIGVPDDRMRVAIVKDLDKGVPHAILIVYAENGEAMILDNQTQTVRSSTMVANYQPIFSINETAWWLHKTPTTTMVASAY